MKTKIKVIKNNGNDEAIFKEAGEIIKNGGLVAFPTETVYGLGGDALNADASKKIYAAKGRPSDNPLIVHICKKEDLERIAYKLDERADILADAFWPGPLTMILPKKDVVPMSTTGGLDTVAIRMPVDKTALRFIEESGGYIAAPSANTSGRPSPTKAEHVYEDLNDKIEMIIDGGSVKIGIESTIVDLSTETTMILRPGFITKEMLEAVVGNVEIDPGILSEDEHRRPKAPGMRYRHYAPKASLTIVMGDKDAVIEKIDSLCRRDRALGKKVGVIAAKETFDSYDADEVECVGMRSNGLSISSHLYDVLRHFDSTNVDVIYSEGFDDTDLGQAIMNRLLKAAGHCCIQAGEDE